MSKFLSLPASFNWMDGDGFPTGGHSIGQSFTIAWQRGPSSLVGRNGAFIIDVLECCFKALTEGLEQAQCLGFTAYTPSDYREEYIAEIIAACLNRIGHFESQKSFSCPENVAAQNALKKALKYLLDESNADRCEDASLFVEVAIEALKSRKYRI
jgi:hypothetical protein